jgi:hypothetical protein
MSATCVSMELASGARLLQDVRILQSGRAVSQCACSPIKQPGGVVV